MPLQKVTKFQVTPMDFSLSLQAMTIEKLKFSLPAVFTIGPDDDEAALTKYAVLLTGQDERSKGSKVSNLLPIEYLASETPDLRNHFLNRELLSI